MTAVDGIVYARFGHVHQQLANQVQDDFRRRNIRPHFAWGEPFSANRFKPYQVVVIQRSLRNANYIAETHADRGCNTWIWFVSDDGFLENVSNRFVANDAPTPPDPLYAVQATGQRPITTVGFPGYEPTLHLTVDMPFETQNDHLMRSFDEINAAFDSYSHAERWHNRLKALHLEEP